MAVMPGVEYRPIDYTNAKSMQRYDIVCVHTIVGRAPAPKAHFSTAGDGHIWQSRDTTYRSAANKQGNYRIIAIENEDKGPLFPAWSGDDVPAFTPAQCESVAQIIAWAHQTHGIPIELCPDSLSTSRGVAYHRQGIDGHWAGYDFGGRVSGGEVWTDYPGKTCPGDRRIHQLIDEIIPRARGLAGLPNEDLASLVTKVQDAVAAGLRWVWPGSAAGTSQPAGGGTTGKIGAQ